MTNTATVSTEILDLLRQQLPSFFTREVAADHLNGIFTKETLANMEHSGDGPPVHFMGRRAFYVKESFLQWLEEYFGGMEVEYHGFNRRVYKRQDAASGAGKAGE